jgi:hypothetical protein
VSKHTKGPWHIGNLMSYDGYTGRPFRNVWAGHDDDAGVVARAIHETDDGEHDVDANAQLIAAAPELLEALEICQEYAISGKSTGCFSGASAELDDIVNVCRAAIAKARGELQ